MKPAPEHSDGEMTPKKKKVKLPLTVVDAETGKLAKDVEAFMELSLSQVDDSDDSSKEGHSSGSAGVSTGVSTEKYRSHYDKIFGGEKARKYLEN